jgi:hypothetical protein
MQAVAKACRLCQRCSQNVLARRHQGSPSRQVGLHINASTMPGRYARLLDSEDAFRPPAQITVQVGILVPSESSTWPEVTSLAAVPSRTCTPRCSSILAAYTWDFWENVLSTLCPRSTKKSELCSSPGPSTGLPAAMERKLALRRLAALRECHWDGATHPSELILELQVAANQHIRIFVVKVGRNLFPNLGPWGALAAQ